MKANHIIKKLGKLLAKENKLVIFKAEEDGYFYFWADYEILRVYAYTTDEGEINYPFEWFDTHNQVFRDAGMFSYEDMEMEDDQP